MSGVAKGIGDLFASVFEIFKGIFEAIGTTIHAAFATVFGLIGSFFNMFEGLVGFLIGNIFIIGTLAAIFFAYSWYQARQGKSVTPVVEAKKHK